MPEQTLGGIPLGLGMVMKINFFEFSCHYYIVAPCIVATGIMIYKASVTPEIMTSYKHTALAQIHLLVFSVIFKTVCSPIKRFCPTTYTVEGRNNADQDVK